MWVDWLVAVVGAGHDGSLVRVGIEAEVAGCAVGTRRTMYQTPMSPTMTIEMRNVVLSRISPTLIEIATIIMETAVIFAR